MSPITSTSEMRRPSGVSFEGCCSIRYARCIPDSQLPTPNFQLPRHFQRPTPKTADDEPAKVGSWWLGIPWELGVGSWELTSSGPYVGPICFSALGAEALVPVVCTPWLAR